MTDQLIINGVRTYDDLGLVLTAVDTKPPAPKIYTVDVPGGDGSIDLTEYSGDVVYANRSDSFSMLSGADNPESIEAVKTRLSGLLHGASASYQLSWDPGYTYRGRFSIEEYPNDYRYGTFVLKVSADPYKSKGTQTTYADAAAGASVSITSGRRRVQPTIEVSRPSLVVFDGREYSLPAGAWKAPGLWLHPGNNTLFLLTYLDAGDVLISTIADTVISSVADDTIASHILASPPATEDYRAYVSYEWEDL